MRLGFERVLELERRIGARHSASSSSVYRAKPKWPRFQRCQQPRNPYTASKLVTETHTLAWGMSAAAVTSAFIDAARKGGPLHSAG